MFSNRKKIQFGSTSSSRFRVMVNNMLLLTDFEVHTGKYLDSSFEVRSELCSQRKTQETGEELPCDIDN